MANSLTEDRTAQDWINLVLAVLLFISPWVVGFGTDTHASWNAWIIGVVIAILSIATLSAFAEWEEWINFVLGLWLIVSPWVLRFAADTHAMWTHVILGILVAAVAAWAVWGHRHIPHAHA
ncbi:SPW repeat protein [Mesorhizobium sp. BAC0120]|uniref:SPW repeat protein n=1 Tax=Mesorhizobium sp. BAC0120 TaxID=3090670 RepID=UPI00298C6BE3|nr:SPW repeat protein [Mesorhizobium sp. BAC0120]MDW6024121.1 SPW repeat protein [Mesorhizobium sp. BAC0120]